jgi:hypothetical protein
VSKARAQDDVLSDARLHRFEHRPFRVQQRSDAHRGHGERDGGPRELGASFGSAERVSIFRPQQVQRPMVVERRWIEMQRLQRSTTAGAFRGDERCGVRHVQTVAPGFNAAHRPR